MKKNLLVMSVALSSLLISASASAADEVVTWSCSESKQFKTTSTGTTEKVRLTWDAQTFDLDRQTSLPGSLRYKNMNSGHDLVVLGNKAMLFNIKAGVRLADFCQTPEMKAGKLPHLFAGTEPFVPN
jgi:hypothetical protein